MSVDENSDHKYPQWQEAYPEALRKREFELFQTRPRNNNKNASVHDPQVGVGLSGGGVRSATFAFGFLQALAKRDALKEIDVLSTVSGGGYVGALISRLYSRERIDVPADVAREILTPHENGNQGGSVWRWLKANGRYLAPAKGSGDILLATAIVIRNWLAVHIVLATFLLALFVGLHLVRETVDTTFPDLAVNHFCAPFGDSIEASAGDQGDMAATPSSLPPFTALDEWLNCQLPFGGTYMWWSPWLLVPALVLGSAVLVGTASCVWGGNIFLRRRHRWSSCFKRLLILFGGTFALAAIDTLGQTIYLWWRDPELSVGAWFLPFFVGIAAVAGVGTNVRTIAARFSDESHHKRIRLPARLAVAVLACLLFGATFTAISALSHGIAWSFKYPLYVHQAFLMSPVRDRSQPPRPGIDNDFCTEQRSFVCSGSRPLQVLECDDCVPVGKRDVGKLFLWFAAFAGLSALVGRFRAFLNHSSLWPLYTARLIRAYLGASNPKRVGLSSTDTEFRGHVTRVVDGDDTSNMLRHGPQWTRELLDGMKKGAPLHLVNVTINETVDGGSGLQHNDLKGIGMAIGPAGMSAGVRHHLVFTRPVMATAEIYPTSETVDTNGSGRPYRIFEYGAKTACSCRWEHLTLGEWAGISGAAVSTGMGLHTSVAASLLLGFFNVRLGYWWDSGIGPRQRKGLRTPKSALERTFSMLFPVQSHLFNAFTARFHGPARRWWNLSDGGHFENLGGYELIRRRLPLIVIVDAEADPDYRFEGLGNLVRKARVDFGASIEFVEPRYIGGETLATTRCLGSLEMLRPTLPGTEPGLGMADVRTVTERGTHQRRSLAHAALARVRYGDGTPDSLLVYVKPTVLGDEPVDILQYHAENPDFPQQTTADQFFDEAQWESYRKLGRLVGERVFEKGLREYLRFAR